MRHAKRACSERPLRPNLPLDVIVERSNTDLAAAGYGGGRISAEEDDE